MMTTIDLTDWRGVVMRYFAHVRRNSSLYPLGTLWLVAMFVIPATFAHWLSHVHAAALMCLSALVLLMITDNRDERTRLRAQVAEVRDLVNKRSDIQDTKIDHLTDVADKDT